jgi:hypothetical protein
MRDASDDANLDEAPVLVVTADRALADRCRALGATVTGPKWLLGLLDETRA